MTFLSRSQTELNKMLNRFSFLSKDIVIHTISSILRTRNLLHFNAKGIKNYFCHCLQYWFSCFLFCFVFCFVFFSKAHSARFTEMHVRLDGRFHFNSTLLKGSRRATTDRISKNFKPNQYAYAENNNWVSVNCAVANIIYIWHKLVWWTVTVERTPS